MDLISIAVELHNWIKIIEEMQSPKDKNDEIIIKKIKIISENLDAVINEHKLYRATEESEYKTILD